jgi:hypothetical protein
LTLRLPDGRIEHIRYFGNQPPAVRFEPAATATAGLDGGDLSPFAGIERISAAMDRQMDAMMRMMGAPEFGAPARDLMSVDTRSLPNGTSGYSFYSVTTNGRTCSTTIRYAADGSGQPKVEKASSGDCSALAKPSMPMKVRTAPTPVPAIKPAAPNAGNVIEAKADGAPALRSSGPVTYHF